MVMARALGARDRRPPRAGDGRFADSRVCRVRPAEPFPQLGAYHLLLGGEYRAGGVAERGRWVDHAIDPFADYRRIWNAAPPPISAIGVMQDTDQTQGYAAAELRRLDWVPSSVRSDATPGP